VEHFFFFDTVEPKNSFFFLGLVSIVINIRQVLVSISID